MQRPHIARACMLLGLGLLIRLFLSGPVRAQEPALPTTSDSAQQAAPQHPSPRAAVLFAEGSALFKQWRFDRAEEKYREALAHWEHPLIHLYLSRALEKQGRLVEAHASLQQALRPGVGALPSEDVQVAGELQKSLESRLAQIEVRCDVPGAEISLDGEPWFTASGRQRRMMSAGQHVLIARKPGYFPVTEPLSLLPGKQTRVVLRMTADVVHIERRWRPWQPWAMAGTGIAMSLVGGLFRWQAANDYAAFEEALESCRQAGSCPLVTNYRLDRGVWRERVGTGALFAGGTILAASLAGVLINLPRTRRNEPAGVLEYELAPIVSIDSTGISAQFKF